MMIRFRIGIGSSIQKNYNDKIIMQFGRGLLISPITYMSSFIVSVVGLDNIDKLVSILVTFWWLFTLYKLLRQDRRAFKFLIKIEVIYFLILLINFLIFPNSRLRYYEVFSYLMKISIYYIPLAVIICMINNYENIEVLLFKDIAFGTILLYVSFLFGILDQIFYQSFGRAVMPFLFLAYIGWMKHRKLKYLVFVVGNFFLVFSGGRQTLIITIIVMFIIFLQNAQKSFSKKLIYGIFFILSIFIVFIYHNELMNLFINFMSSLNPNSRIIRKITEGQLFSFGTRTEVYEIAISIIRTRGIRMAGLLGDRYYLIQYSPNIPYPHNIILEFLIDFGTFFGSILIILYYSISISAYVKFHEEKKLVYACFWLMENIRLLVSGSFVIDYDFYLILGFLFSIYYQKTYPFLYKENR